MAEKDTSAQRLKLLYLRDIFQKFTSETEALTRNQITDILLDYGITEGRKAFPRTWRRCKIRHGYPHDDGQDGFLPTYDEGFRARRAEAPR